MHRPGGRARSAATVFALVVGLHACGLVVDTCACTRIAPGVVIEGRVLDIDGAAVPSAIVEAWVRDDACDATAALQTRADANAVGAYAAFVGAFGAAQRVCVDLLAIDISETELDSAWVRDLVVDVPADSVSVVVRDIHFGG